MKNRNIFSVLLFTIVFSACVKSPTPEILEGTWLEEDGLNSKLIFDGDLFYFFHDPVIDTLTYSLDEKHSLMWIVPLDSSSGGSSHPLEWHKRKKILVIMGLFPSTFGNKSKSYYKKQ